MKSKIETLEDFASLCWDMQRSDRGVNIVVSGFTGEGKSTFTIKFAQAWSNISGVPFTFDRLTWSRKELLTWVDGEPGSKKDEAGLRKGQLPEYSLIIPDELFKMMYRRTWYEGDQIDMIATFNACRDRHLLVIGCNPYFWDLDSAFTSQIRFYVYICERGTAWVFEQENNPFSIDPWNTSENRTKFRKDRSPSKLANFVCQIEYPDFMPDERLEYYKIRNSKRLLMLEDGAKKGEGYKDIKAQRDKAIKLADYVLKTARDEPKFKLTDQFIAKWVGLGRETIRIARNT